MLWGCSACLCSLPWGGFCSLQCNYHTYDEKSSTTYNRWAPLSCTRGCELLNTKTKQICCAEERECSMTAEELGHLGNVLRPIPICHSKLKGHWFGEGAQWPFDPCSVSLALSHSGDGIILLLTSFFNLGVNLSISDLAKFPWSSTATLLWWKEPLW